MEAREIERALVTNIGGKKNDEKRRGKKGEKDLVRKQGKNRKKDNENKNQEDTRKQEAQAAPSLGPSTRQFDAGSRSGGREGGVGFYYGGKFESSQKLLTTGQ